MSYDIGTHINLQPADTTQVEESRGLFEVGTEIVFKFLGDRVVASRRIPVVFA